MQPDHTSANRIIAGGYNPHVLGMKDGRDIVRIEVELPDKPKLDAKVRVICYAGSGDVLDISEAGSIIDIAAYLGREFAVSRQYLMDIYDFRAAYDQRFLESIAFADEQKKTAGLMAQFVAGEVVYSVVEVASVMYVYPNQPSKIIPKTYEVFAQHKGEEDPDTALILEECHDTLFAATMSVRSLIEKDLFQEFMPELIK